MPLRVVAAFALMVVLFDAIWASISLSYGYEYGTLFWVEWLLYAGAGAVAGTHHGSRIGALAGGTVAAVDATVGWWVSAVIGPGTAPGDRIVILVTIAIVVASGVMLGGAGAWLAVRIEQRLSDHSS